MAKVNTGTDLLSSLDESLLLRILGLMETVDAVRTCVLSKRWRDLWNSLPAFRACEIERYIDAISFPDFINQFIHRRDSCQLHEVRLYAPHEILDTLAVEAVVQYAVKHGVRDMILDFSGVVATEFEFPRCFSHCQSLQKLELITSCGQYILPKKMGLTALTSLRLDNISFSEDNFDGSLFSASPNLQTLHLFNVSFHGLVTYDIHAPSLTTLMFTYSEFCPWCFGRDCYTCDCKFVIIAPKLTTFVFSGPTPITCSVDAPSLEDVYIDLSAPGKVDCVEDEELKHLVLCSIKMVNEFRVARCMTMTPGTIKVISALPNLLDGHLSKFENLNHLAIKMDEAFVLSPCILKYFLNSTTKLEVY